jgi:NAD(P)-dependent dehydrogenase (short-subunit alcohol dehydrogenase family)
MSKKTPLAIVTGGGGSIGSAIARGLAERGFSLIIADINASNAERVAAEVNGTPFVGDLSKQAATNELAELVAATGVPHQLVNSAGISPKQDGHKKSFLDIDADEFSHVMAVNLLAPFQTIRALVPLMPIDGTASIVNIGSITGRMGAGGAPDAVFPPWIPASSHYAASKAAVHNLGASLSRELAPLKIRINTVAPGMVATELTSNVSAEDNAVIAGQIPLGRAATASEIADAVVWLGTAEARYITGAVLDVNGGWLPG